MALDRVLAVNKLTVQNATVKSEKPGVRPPVRAIETCSTIAAVQMPSVRVSCWKVE